MPQPLDPHPSFPGRPGPLLIVVADGVGIAPPGPSNAVSEADTPTIDALVDSPLATEIAAHGEAVGLPTDDDMGNSEVGHNALGAGRVFAQGAKLVNRAIADRSIFETEVWREIIRHGTEHTLHFLGLHSDGNVHSHNDQLYALMEAAVEQGVSEIRVHILLDGRDVPPRSALDYIAQTEQVIRKLNEEHGANVRIATGGGRMKITMDRYEADWPMVERGYHCHTHGIGRHFSSATEAVETMYRESDAGDQNLDAFVIVDEDDEPVGRMHDGDTLVPEQYLVAPPAIDRTMGELLCKTGVRSFAVSETQKYGHVTYFWNGNRSGYLDPELETYVEIPSDIVPFDQAPEMKAREITDTTIELLRSGHYRFGRINFANGDMVGHTGNLGAAIVAMEVVDENLGRLVEVIDELGGILIFTADHGNADIMYTETDGVRTPKTSHTLSPVPFAIHDPGYSGEYRLEPPADAGLSHVASTALNLLGYQTPPGYQPSLVVFPQESA